MMHVLLDTNVVLDVLLKRAPWVTESMAVWQANDEGRIVGNVLASAITDIFYIAVGTVPIHRQCRRSLGF